MVEREALLSIRTSIIEGLAESRPDSLNEELVDEIRAIDWQLGASALFVLSRDNYVAPAAVQYEDVDTPQPQELTLF